MSLNVLNDLQEIVENVLEHLSVMEINKFMILNKVWNNAGKKVKKNRPHTISWYTFHKIRKTSFDEAKAFVKNIYSEPQCILALLSSGRQDNCMHPKKLKKDMLKFQDFIFNCAPSRCITASIVTWYITTYDNSTKCAEELKNTATCIFFPRMQDIDVQVVVNSEQDNFCFHPCMHPINSSIHPINSPMHQTHSSCHANNLCSQENNAIALYKEQISQDLKTENYSENVGNKINPSSPQKNVSNTIKNTEKSLKRPKLLLYFSNEYSQEHIEQLSNHFKCPIAGSLVQNTYAGELGYPGLGVVFSGGEEMRVAMVVVDDPGILGTKLRAMRSSMLAQLGGDDGGEEKRRNGGIGGSRKRMYCARDGNSNEERGRPFIDSGKGGVESNPNDSQEINKLKGYKRMHGWMFSCVGNLPDANNSSTSRMFSKIFPNVPLFGSYGSGEICQNIYGEEVTGEDESHDGDGRKRRIGADDFLNTYSTVFVIMAIRK